ncbi:MAG: hypothetical protein LBR86_01145 [Tannerella sp.]|jgi:uncharacterized protein (DUF2141 family)|nr:hypothetical protein [Tannerella sp.]
MNKKIKLIILFISAITMQMSAQERQPAGMIRGQTLTVKVHNIKPVGGNLMVDVFNSETGFPDVYFKGEKFKSPIP